MSSELNMLFLSENDLINAGVLDAKRCAQVMEEMFTIVGEKDYLLGGPNENAHGVKIWFPKEKRSQNMPAVAPDRRFMALVSYLGGDFNVAGEKWYGSNASNVEKDLPRSILTITLNNIDTGQPLTYMTGNLISAMRTGAVPAVASNYLSSTGADTLAIIGAGVISWSSVLAILAVNKNIKQVKVFDIKQNKAEDFCRQLKQTHDIQAFATNTMEEALTDADYVNIATSGSVQPEVNEDHLKDGAVLMISGGAKITDEFLLNNRIVFDNWEMHKTTAQDWVQWEYLQSGVENLQDDLYYGIGGQIYKLVEENKLNESDITDLSDIVTGKNKARQRDQETIVFLATEDIAWAYTLYKEAVQKDLGQTLQFWDEPYWS